MRFLSVCLVPLVVCLASDPFTPEFPPERPFSTTPHEHLVGGLVNPFTGQFSLSATDLIANGTEPIALIRHYYPPHVQWRYSNNKQKNENQLGLALANPSGWIFFPYLVANYRSAGSKEGFITITEPDGSRLVFKRNKHGAITLDSKGPFTNSDGQVLSSSYDSRNTRCSFESNQLIVHSKDGSTRYYEFNHSNDGGRFYYLKKERLPNGRWLVYSYEERSLVAIESKDPHEQYTYAKLTKSGEDWSTHTGQTAHYEFSSLSHNGWYFVYAPPGRVTYGYTIPFLSKAESPLSHDSYGYIPEGLLCWRSEKFSSSYAPYKEFLRVSDIELPKGEKTHSIQYHSNCTSVIHPDGTTSLYAFSKEGFPRSVHHEEQELCYTWLPNGRLYSVEIPGLYRKEYLSDSLGNPVEETFIYDEPYTIYREYIPFVNEKFKLIEKECKKNS